MTLVLIHSPLVGPLTWRGVAVRMDGPVVVADLSGAVDSRPSHHQGVADAVAMSLSAVDPQAPVILVGHSSAGALLPRIAQTVSQPVSAVIYVDSRLPYPGESWTANAPGPLVDQRRDLVRDGRLPPWHEWFPSGSIAEILPDPQLRAEFVREVPRLPFTYFTEPMSADTWSGPAGYLLLSEGYRPDADAARGAGMPVVEHVDHHLAMLTAPAAVAVALERLIRVVGVPL